MSADGIDFASEEQYRIDWKAKLCYNDEGVKAALGPPLSTCDRSHREVGKDVKSFDADARSKSNHEGQLIQIHIERTAQGDIDVHRLGLPPLEEGGTGYGIWR